MNNRQELFRVLQEAVSKAPLIMAIDGRCAAGKTTLATELAKAFDCNVIHMDDFYLPMEKRTPQIMEQPGGNIDFERLTKEILVPLSEGKTIEYCPYDCHNNLFLPAQKAEGSQLTVVEGSYSCHPKLKNFYKWKVFVDISEELQLARLKERNPERLEAFQRIWIPREEHYFNVYDIREHCDFLMDPE